MTLVISCVLIVLSFVAGVLVERKNGLVARAQAGRQDAIDAIKAKLNLK